MRALSLIPLWGEVSDEALARSMNAVGVVRVGWKFDVAAAVSVCERCCGGGGVDALLFSPVNMIEY